MPDGSVDPASLDGDDLDRWYRRTPSQIDQERRAAAAQRYADFFGGLGSPPSGPDPASPTPGWKPVAADFPQNTLLPVDASLLQQPSGSSPAPIDGPPNGSRVPGLLGDRATLTNAASGAPTRPDPAHTDVFTRGVDGQLHPIPGWHTTGPFDFGAWAHNIDWNGAVQNLGDIANGVLEVESGKAAGDALLDALGPDVRRAVERGIFGLGNQHHPFPSFMGGPADQELVNMAPPMHQILHRELNSALRATGSPPIGGTAGPGILWQKIFAKYPETHDAAINILRQVTRNFDLERGTSITPTLDKALGSAKPGTPPNK